MYNSYSGEQEQISINLRGVDLTVEKTDVGESPYRLDRAPDTSKNPISLSFADDEDEPSPVLLSGGEATLSGTVSDGSEPVPGAIVRIERLTDDGSAYQDIRASQTGTWAATELLGGRYRVRAWLPGRYMMNGSSVFYANDEEETTLDLVVREVESQLRMKFHHGGPIYDRLTGSAVVTVTEESVDKDGYLTTQPVPGKVVKITANSPIEVISSSQGATNSKGEFGIKLKCERVGKARALLEMDDQKLSVDLPSCIPIPPPPPTPEEKKAAEEKAAAAKKAAEDKKTADDTRTSPPLTGETD